MHFQFVHKQLFCPVKTMLIHKEELFKHSDLGFFSFPSTLTHDDSYFYDSTGKFKKTKKGRDFVYYMCEYVPSRLSPSDTRSNNFVLDFKVGNRANSEKALKVVVDTLVRVLPHNCALLAVPPSNVARNGITPCHKAIAAVVAKIGQEKNIIDASDCLIRINVNDHEKPAHEGGSRNINHHLNSIRLKNDYKIQDKNVIILDDITTSGSSFAACEKIVENAAKSIAFFSVGRTISGENLRPGFILDIDGTLFDTERGEIKKARDENPWSDNLPRLAQYADPMPGAQELINKIKSICANFTGADYRLVTTAPKAYATVLARKLRIEPWRVIAYEDTGKGMQKPCPQPYLLAKQQMGLYEPSIIAIGDRKKDIIPAQTLGMTSVLIGSNDTGCNSTFAFPTLQDCVNNFWQILQPACQVWDALANDYEKANVAQYNIGVYEAKKAENSTQKPQIESAPFPQNFQSTQFSDFSEPLKDKNTSSVPRVSQPECSRDTLACLLAFSDIRGLGVVGLHTYADELASVKTEDEIYSLFKEMQKKWSRVDQNLSKSDISEKLHLAHLILDEHDELGIGTITFKSSGYQSIFAKDPHAPLYFFYKGNADALWHKSISIINMNLDYDFAIKKSQKFSQYIADKGWYVITSNQSYIDCSCYLSQDIFDKPKSTCIVTTFNPLEQAGKEDSFKEEVLASGGCIVSPTPRGKREKHYTWSNEMALQAVLSKGIFAFGYDPAHKEKYNNKDNYYSILRKAARPLLCYKCTEKQLLETPYMAYNNDLLSMPGAASMTYTRDIDAFLDRCLSTPK